MGGIVEFPMVTVPPVLVSIGTGFPPVVTAMVKPANKLFLPLTCNIVATLVLPEKGMYCPFKKLKVYIQLIPPTSHEEAVGTFVPTSRAVLISRGSIFTRSPGDGEGDAAMFVGR